MDTFSPGHGLPSAVEDLEAANWPDNGRQLLDEAEDVPILTVWGERGQETILEFEVDEYDAVVGVVECAFQLTEELNVLFAELSGWDATEGTMAAHAACWMVGAVMMCFKNVEGSLHVVCVPEDDEDVRGVGVGGAGKVAMPVVDDVDC